MQGDTADAPLKTAPDQTTCTLESARGWPSARSSSPQQVTLEPFRTNGADSLLPNPRLSVLGAKLSQLTTAAPTASYLETSTTGEDIYRSAAEPGKQKKLIPRGHRLLRAILTVWLKGFARPRTVEISPPNTIKFQDPADAPLLLPFLSERGFILIQKAVQAATTLLLILMVALAPSFDDNDGDEDDDDGDSERTLHHHSFHYSTSPVFHCFSL